MAPPSKPVFFPIVLLLVVALVIFSPALVKWEPVTRLFRSSGRRHQVARPDAKVWVNRASGFYYCPGTSLYGKVQPGAYMSQGEAVQTGFRPIGDEPCP